MQIVAFLLCLLIAPTAYAITSILGASVANPGPLVGILCSGSTSINCPQYMHPDWTDTRKERFFGVTNRVNPGLCVQSTDQARSFSVCATQPFAAAVLNIGIKFAVSSNGSLLAASGQGAQTCIIRRSTDKGLTWSTVYSTATEVCSVLYTSPAPPEFYCSEQNGYCALIDGSGTPTVKIIQSTNNGASWSVHAPNLTMPSADSKVWGPILSQDGTVGIISHGSNETTGQPFATSNATGLWATTPNYFPSVNQSCRPYLSGATQQALCLPNAGGTTLTKVNASGVPFEDGSIILSVLPFEFGWLPANINSQNGLAIVLSKTVNTLLYTFSTGSNWSATSLRGGLTYPTSLFGCCAGNQLTWGDAVYFTSGYSGSNAVVLKGTS